MNTYSELRGPFLAILAAALAAGCGAGDAEREPDAAQTEAPAVDSHLHIRTEAAAGLPTVDEGETSPEATTADDVIAALDEAGIDRGLVLSVAYQFGDPDLTVDDEAALVRRENAYVARQVARFPDRLTAACSVNPLAAYATEEVERCASELGVTVLKLHLTNSDVDLRSDAHLQRLREVFRLLDRIDGAALIHLRTRREDYGAQDVRRFVDEVLAESPSVPVQVAHMGGWGGYDVATDAALAEFAHGLATGRLDRERIWFGLGAVVFLPEAAGADTALARTVREANAQLAGRIRQIGLDRIVYGTDWPGWPPVPDPARRIAASVELLRAASGLESDELRQIFSNQGVMGRLVHPD